jgi:hypothetical protein
MFGYTTAFGESRCGKDHDFADVNIRLCCLIACAPHASRVTLPHLHFL